MNKAQLVEFIAHEADLSKKDASAALDATVSAITTALADGDSVTLVGFGSFVVADRKAREGRVPGSNKKIKIKAAKVPKFRPGKALKEALN